MTDKVTVTLHFERGDSAPPRVEFSYPNDGTVPSQAVSTALQRVAGNIPPGVPGDMPPGEHVGTITVRRNDTTFAKGLGVELNVPDPSKLTPVELGRLLVEIGSRLQRSPEGNVAL